jgi:6-pyruvoyltetrahydropterin/6-carboxytetrahydropterin synthase
MAYTSTKTYGHETGLSCCFRQWRATHSHCQNLHGYALSIHLKFEATALDDRNWVVDFGGLKDLKRWLQDTFDHTTVTAHDDPHLDWFHRGHEIGILKLVILPDVGCERFAALVWAKATEWLETNGLSPRCRVTEVEVREHGANSAIYRP